MNAKPKNYRTRNIIQIIFTQKKKTNHKFLKINKNMNWKMWLKAFTLL